jgi:hypothetical protein
MPKNGACGAAGAVIVDGAFGATVDPADFKRG